jgi:hypothetical protein
LASPNENTVPLHRRITHPEFVEGCWGCKVASVSLSVPIAFRAVLKDAKEPRRIG